MTIGRANEDGRRSNGEKGDNRSVGRVDWVLEKEQAPDLQRPPNTVPTVGLYQTGYKLVNSYWKRQTGEHNEEAGQGTGAGAKTGMLSSVGLGVMFYLNHSILLVVFFVISIYKNVQFMYRRSVLKFLTLAYYPNRSPQLIRDDVTKLAKIPRRISCILNLKDEDDENGGIDGLVNNISEICAWTISAGLPELSIYEYNGVIKNHLPELVRYVNKTLSVYFGTDSLPVICIKVPHSNLVVYSSNPYNDPSIPVPSRTDLELVLLSYIDSKPTIVELTKTMCELAIAKELSIQDISVGLIDEELSELVGPEPDLLIYFGPSLDLQEYPPWHIRLSEIYWEPDNKDVNYAVFIRALQKYANCKVNVGR